ncbi:MAG: hypothetical protein JXR66_08255 [Bacteroidales bacterium]|nr:hypothetical protein [Bacteroidales bacterium]
MKNQKTLSIICTLLFLTGIVAAFFGFLNQGNRLFTYLLLLVTVIYLILGWYIFRGYYPDGHPLLLFLMGYLYASVVMSWTFTSAGWPLSNTFLWVGVAWVLIQSAMVTAVKKKLSPAAFTQFLIEALLMLIMTIAMLLYIS